MSSHLNHLLYVGQVSDLNKKVRSLTREGGNDVSEIAEKAVTLASQFLIENCEEYLDAFSNQSAVFFQRRDFESARLLLRKMVDKIDVDLLNDSEKRVYSSILNNLAVCHFSIGDFMPASKYMAKSFNLKKKLRYGYYELTGLVEDLTESYIRTGQLEKAKQCWSDMSEIAVGEFGMNSYQYLDSLGDQVNFSNDHGFTEEAERLDIEYSELETRLNSERLSGEKYRLAVEEAKCQYDLGNFQFARQIHERIIASTPALPGLLSSISIMGGTMDPLAGHATELDGKALAFQNGAELSRAIPLYEQVVEILRTSLGKENIRVGFALNNLGDAKRLASDFEGAKEALLACLEIINLPLNRGNQNRETMLENYVQLVYQQSLAYSAEIDSAENLAREFQRRDVPEDFARSMRIRMVVPFENEKPVEVAIRRLEARVVFYESIGSYQVALRLYKDIADVCGVYYIFKPEKAIDARLKLAAGYVYQSDFTRAEEIYLSVLAFAQENMSVGSSEYIFVLRTIAAFYCETGDNRKGSRYFEKALGLCLQMPERMGRLEHELKMDLIAAYSRGQGNESTELIREMLSEIDPEEITDPVELQTFASYYTQLMEMEKSEPLYQKAISLLRERTGEWTLSYALAISNLATCYRFQKRYREAARLYDQSLRIRQVELGIDHPKLAGSLSRLALTYGALGDAELATEVVKRMIDIDDRAIANVYDFGSRDQKLAFLEGINNNTDLCMSVILRFSGDIPGLTKLGLELVQKRKSILTGMLQNESADPRAIAILEELGQLKRGIASLNGETSAELTERASERVAELERQLNSVRVSANNNADLEHFVLSSQAGMAGLEILKIRCYNFNVDVVQNEPEAFGRYIGFFVDCSQTENVKLFDFGATEEIDDEITLLRSLILTKKDIGGAIKLLSDRLVLPLARSLETIQHIVVCPDGNLSLLPFDLLLFQGEPVIDRFTVSYSEKLSTVFRTGQVGDNTEVLVFAAPDYFGHSGSGDAENSELVFMPLAGAFEEGQKVAAITGGRLVSGRDASKSFFEGIHSPVILHVATHAFYGRSFPGFENMRLFKSGLALAGANNLSDPGGGIITAEEVSHLNMHSTELVVLSACNTAQGEYVEKEGVFGLERAFKEAGAKRVVASLWEVPDKATTLLMESFYGNLYDGVDVANALSLAKCTLRSKMPDPIYWSAFILNGNVTRFPLPGR